MDDVITAPIEPWLRTLWEHGGSDLILRWCTRLGASIAAKPWPARYDRAVPSSITASISPPSRTTNAEM